MRSRGFRRLVLLFLLTVPLCWLSCSTPPDAATPAGTELAAVPSTTPTRPTATTAPTNTATQTPQPTNTAPAPPTPTSLPTTTPTFTITPSPTLTPVNRACPDPTPEKPDYRRYVLGMSPWPTPDPAGFTPHFWLSVPRELESADEAEDGEAERLQTNPHYPYGYDANDRYLLHNGIDISGSLGTTVLAVADGTVVLAQDDFTEWYGWRCNWYGHLLVLELDERWHGMPVYVLYGHVLNFLVEPGQRVTAGQPIVQVGVGGVATAPHLHLEVRVGGNEFGMTRNPLLWLQPAEGRGVIAGRILDPTGRPWQGVLVTAAGQRYATSWTYLDDPLHLINPDEELAENFVIGDLPPGRYQVITSIQGEEYRAEVEVRAGEISTVEIVTAPFKTPTPTPPVTATPTSTPTSDAPLEATATPTPEATDS